jgi:signal transduction histidine kinase
MLNEIEQKYSELLDVDGIFSAVLQQMIARARADVAAILLVDDVNGEAQWSAIEGTLATPPAAYFKIDSELHQALQHDGVQMFFTDRPGFPLPASLQQFAREESLRAVCMVVLKAGKHRQGMLLAGYRQEQYALPNEHHEMELLAERYALPITNVGLYRELGQREKDMVTLSTIRVAVQEEERHRIAREIHDGLGQLLTAIKFNLEILEDTIRATDDERERIRDMKELLDSVMKEARELSYNLMPSVLEDFGLAPALQLLTEQYGNRTGIKTAFHVHGLAGRVDPQIEVALYRIAQESFNNISKHAQATEVNLQIIGHDRMLRLVVEDNGRGMVIPQAHMTGKSGIGLVSMRERAASFGGTLMIDSTLGGGTMLSVEIPLPQDAE